MTNPAATARPAGRRTALPLGAAVLAAALMRGIEASAPPAAEPAGGPGDRVHEATYN